MTESHTVDVAVVGAGVFGSWTAWHLVKRGLQVLLLDAYGAAHSRASSGGETRIIRMSYAADEIYTRWSQRSLAQWKELSAISGQQLFHQTGVLWMESGEVGRLSDSQITLARCGIAHMVMDHRTLTKRYPQANFDGVTRGLLEPDSGVLMARRGVQTVIEQLKKKSVEFRITHVGTPREARPLASISTSHGETFSVGQFVFACGPWLGKVFPELLGQRIFPTRQEVFFSAARRGTRGSRRRICPRGCSTTTKFTACRTSRRAV